METTDSSPGPARRQACITGASSGIGATFAKHLASSQHDLILIARRKDRLEALANLLEQKHGAQVQVWAYDLAEPDSLQALADQLAQLSSEGGLDLLVNNAGFGVMGPFAGISAEEHLRMVRVHVEANVLLTRAVLPGMVARRQGGIICVSSVASFFALPMNGLYSSTKSFLTNFCRTLALELRGTGVHIQALCPGFTYSEFHETMGIQRPGLPGLAWMTADAVVKDSLNALARGRVVYIPGLFNWLLVHGSGLLPRAWVDWLGGLFVKNWKLP